MSVQDIYNWIIDSIPPHQLEKASNIIAILYIRDGQVIRGENDVMAFSKKYHEGVISVYSDLQLVEVDVSKASIQWMGMVPKAYIN